MNWMRDMKIIVTGARGFIGKNLCTMLIERGYTDLVKVDIETGKDELVEALHSANFIFHLAGVNRPANENEFTLGNVDLTDFIISELEKSGNKAPLMISSSTQALRSNAYGTSKAQAEKIVETYHHRTGAEYYIYRLPNVFGKWCRPNYNSFVATFCHNIANGQDIIINDPSASVTLVYIDDVCAELIALLSGSRASGLNYVRPEYQTTVGEVAQLLQEFKSSRDSLIIDDVGSGFVRALYSTFISYYQPAQFSYDIKKYADDRGVFCEMLKTKTAGQFSFFTAYPGVTRGGHYHHTKNEKFLVVKGNALFKFEHIITGERYELVVSSESFEIVETVPGWSHDVTNIGDEELVVMLWANEIFDRNLPDTIAKAL